MYVSTQNSDGYGDIKVSDINDEKLASIIPDVSSDPEIDSVIISLEGVKELKNDSVYLTVVGTISNGKTAEKLSAVIRLKNEFGKPATVVRSGGENGIYSFRIEKYGKYQLEVEHEGFLTIHEQIEYTASASEILEINLNLFPIEAGTKFNLKHVNFYQGTSELIESSYDELNLVAQMMLQNPEIEIELAGHTDNRGSPRLNQELSEQRVQVVKNYLAEKGVNGKRLNGEGYGGARPIASNATEETRKLNRRVEFIIIKD